MTKQIEYPQLNVERERVIDASNSDIGKLGGLIGAILFLSFPSSLLWYGQNHKDAFFIFSIL